MDNGAELEAFVNAIRRQLPNEAAETDDLMRERGFDACEELGTLWVEALADVVNARIRQRNQQAIEDQFQFFSEQFDRGSKAIRKCIDAAYVENLMCGLDAEDKKWAWPQLPGNLKNLYIATWGDPLG